MIDPSDGRLAPPSSNVPAPIPRLWAEGRLRLRLVGPDGSGTIVLVQRPFALIGRSATADLPVPHRDASLRHVYLHLDGRGLFAVDLASRTGTRFDDAPPGSRACWILPGRGLELAGHRVELLEAVPAPDPSAGLPGADPLAEAAGPPPLELRAEDDPDRPIALLSELSFLGRSRACAVRAEGGDAARVHAVIVRSAAGGFIVNLVGSGLTINDSPTTLAAPLRQGDRLGLGRHRFAVHLRPASPAIPTTRLPRPDSADLTRALRAVRDGQDELIRTNDQFQHALIAAVRQLYREQSALFERHLDRLDRLQNEVAALRDELRERLPRPPDGAPALDPSTALPPSALPPLEIPRPALGPDPGGATSWLLDRLGALEDRVEEEARSGWRDLLSRLGTPLRPRDDS